MSGPRGLAVAVVVAIAACAAPAPQASPSPAAQSAPTIPPGWSWVVSGQADLMIALPPWLVAFDTSGAIFANEVRADRRQGMQLMAEGPRTAEPQPAAAGGDLQRWLEMKIGAPGQGLPRVRPLDLPAGPALGIDRLDRAGTATAWRLSAYAITTPVGTAFLLVDGPPDAWVGREADLGLVATLLEPAPGTRP